MPIGFTQILVCATITSNVTANINPIDQSRNRAEQFLLQAKANQGAWFPYKAGGESSLEATAWSLIALRKNEALSLAVADYLAQSQNAADGGWSTAPGAGRSDWNSGPVLLSLRIIAGLYPQKISNRTKLAINKGLSYLLDSRIDFYGPTARLLLLLSKGPEGLAYGRGWPWDPKCFHWIEPTSYCLMALKLPQRPQKELDQQSIKLADKFITEHACRGGGWNHGNELSLGAYLPPFRLTTAEALLAIQDNKRSVSIEEALKFLQSQAKEDSSSLSLALSILALDAYNLTFSEELQNLLKRQANDGSYGPNLMTTAMAILALEAAQGLSALKITQKKGSRP